MVFSVAVNEILPHGDVVPAVPKEKVPDMLADPFTEPPKLLTNE